MTVSAQRTADVPGASVGAVLRGRMARADAELFTPRPFELTTFLTNERILGPSKLARVVQMFARRPQMQERLTTQVADWLQTKLSPRGIGVVLEAEHLCMAIRRVQAGGTSIVTPALHDLLRDDASPRAESFTLAVGQRVSAGEHHG